MLIVDGILAPTRDHIIAAQSNNYGYGTSLTLDPPTWFGE